MLPYLSRKSSLLKEDFTLRSSAGRKPMKRTTKKRMPFCRLRTERSARYVLKLDQYRCELKLAVITVPEMENGVPLRYIGPVRRKDKTIGRSRDLKTFKKTRSKKEESKKKGKISNNLQKVLEVDSSNQGSLTWRAPPMFKCTPSHTVVYEAQKGRVRGGDSIFAVPGFNASVFRQYSEDEDGSSDASWEAHEEMQREIAYSSFAESDDQFPSEVWDSGQMSALFEAQVAWYRRQAAEKQKIRDLQVGDWSSEYAGETELVDFDQEMTDAFCVDAVAGSRSMAEIGSRSASAPFEDMEVSDVEMVAAETLCAVPAAPATQIDNNSTPDLTFQPVIATSFRTRIEASDAERTTRVSKPLRPPVGARRAVPMNLVLC